MKTARIWACKPNIVRHYITQTAPSFSAFMSMPIIIIIFFFFLSCVILQYGFDLDGCISDAAPAVHATAAPTCSIMQTDPTQDAGLPTIEPSAQQRGLYQSNVCITSLRFNLHDWDGFFKCPKCELCDRFVHLRLLLSFLSAASFLPCQGCITS